MVYLSYAYGMTFHLFRFVSNLRWALNFYIFANDFKSYAQILISNSKRFELLLIFYTSPSKGFSLPDKQSCLGQERMIRERWFSFFIVEFILAQ